MRLHRRDRQIQINNNSLVKGNIFLIINLLADKLMRCRNKRALDIMASSDKESNNYSDNNKIMIKSIRINQSFCAKDMQVSIAEVAGIVA